MDNIQINDVVKVGSRYAEITGINAGDGSTVQFYYIRYFTGGTGSCPPALCEKTTRDIASLVAEEMDTSLSVALCIINAERRIEALEELLRLKEKS